MFRQKNTEHGVTLLAFIGIMAVIMILSMTIYNRMLTDIISTARLVKTIQLFQLCEAGIELALYKLNYEDAGFDQIPLQQLGPGAFCVNVVRTGGDEIKLIVTAQIPATKPSLTRSVTAKIVKHNGKYLLSSKVFF
ncbi:MAG: hypothetical protein N2246_07315 [Candidatus Sumerlaeia bacterium]|nr:hypothetical protein [Candidatus Sumerlaeia bacterium]